jgi:oxygen-independent coproporphyrinogen-3 oxidase
MYQHLLGKYNQAVPRYTSYPTVPTWDANEVTSGKWRSIFTESFQSLAQKELALYVHLPYCESLCTYCGCNKRITKNHRVEKPYLDAVIHEWKMYRRLIADTPFGVKQLHLGGGTPTFFSADNLEYLIRHLLEDTFEVEDKDYSLEIHPSVTKKSQLAVLQSFGFNRLSIGIQDFDPIVQHAIHRIQSFDVTKQVFHEARELGYTGLNADMVYGLPFQTPFGLEDTLEKVMSLRPDRISFYGSS